MPCDLQVVTFSKTFTKTTREEDDLADINWRGVSEIDKKNIEHC